MTKNVIYDNSKLLHSKLFLNNGVMKETETQLFFPEDLYYFELSFMYLCFPNGLTPRFILDFAVICFWNRVKRNKKIMVSGQLFFMFKFLKFFEIYEKILVPTSTNISDKLSMFLELLNLFVKILILYNLFEAYHFHCRILFDMYYHRGLSKSRGSG